MPQFHSDAADTATSTLDAFTAAYITAAYWTDTGDGEQPSSEAELADEARVSAVEQCADFQREHADLLSDAYARVGYDAARAGHDFWLTRNGHGTGFWDRDELDAGGLGERLSKAARIEGGSDLYEGDNGKLYFSP